LPNKPTFISKANKRQVQAKGKVITSKDNTNNDRDIAVKMTAINIKEMACTTNIKVNLALA
jgi:hypothetical protein